MDREEWLKTLKSDEGTAGYELENGIETPRTILLAKIREDTRKNGEIEGIKGAFGPETGGDGLIEEVIKNGKGVFLKFYGCSYLYKGYPDKDRVHGIEFAKHILFDYPRRVVAKSPIYLLTILIKFIFSRKRLVRDVDEIAYAIDQKVTKHLDIPEEEYRVSIRELKRAFFKSINVKGEWPHPIQVKTLGEQVKYLMARLARFIFLFLESDTAYCYRVQDGFGTLDKTKDPIKELLRIVELMLSRETKEGIGDKWKFIHVALKLVLMNKTVRGIMSDFISNIDPEKVKMDESDWYFSLKFLSYDFGGLSVEERWALRDKIDQEKGHIMLAV